MQKTGEHASETRATKTCTKCKIELPATLEFFYASKSYPSGMEAWCRACKAAYRADRKAICAEYSAEWRKANDEKYRAGIRNYYARNREKILEKKRAMLSDPDYAKSIREKHAVHRAANRDVARTRTRLWREQNRERHREAARAWARNNRDAASVIQQRRRAAKAGTVRTLTSADWRYAVSYFGNACAYCGSVNQLTKEHVVPISLGGGTTRENVVPACKRCNSSKGAKELRAWYVSTSYFSEDRLAKLYAYMREP